MLGNSATGGLPNLSAPEHIDAWPSEEATRLAFSTLRAIVDRGYPGVVIEAYSLADGRVIGRFSFNEATPEGRLAQGLLAFASIGRSQPAEQSIAILERIYREQDLPLPKNKRPGV